MDWDTIGLYLGVILTFCTLSFLYKENWFFRIAEHIFVGLAAAYTVVNYWHNYVKPIVQNDVIGDGRYGLILCMLVGLTLYTRLIPRLSWMSRIPIALEVGYGVGYSLALGPRSYLVNLGASFIEIAPEGASFANILNNLIFFLCIVVVLSYFIFTRQTDRGVLKVTSAAGRWVMMVAFGAAFGNTIQARIALLIGRLQFLLGNWLGWLPE
jgi:hypothetical protein